MNLGFIPRATGRFFKNSFIGYTLHIKFIYLYSLVIFSQVTELYYYHHTVLEKFHHPLLCPYAVSWFPLYRLIKALVWHFTQ